jgi:ATP-binding protein involved in chromosome partitioning
MAHTAVPAPLEIGRANGHDVRVRWADGHESIYPSVDLRLACPCVSCKPQAGPAARGQIRILPAGIQSVHPVRIELTGGFGIRIHWSDGHSQGLYGFLYLRALCPCCREQTPIRIPASAGVE